MLTYFQHQSHCRCI